MTLPASNLLVTRRVDAAPETVWRSWTTRAGLEAWWGPVGFVSTVQALDVRVGGGFDIAMLATAPGQVAYLSAHGIPLESHARGTYVDVAPVRRLAWRSVVDFAPGVAPYDVTAAVDLRATAEGATELTFRGDPLHDAMWTRNAETGWTQQLDKLVAQFAGSTS